jgi:hypothetical protein
MRVAATVEIGENRFTRNEMFTKRNGHDRKLERRDARQEVRRHDGGMFTL